MNTQEIVAKLWNLCNVLRDDGITYHQYVTELTYILFLKMAKETYTEDPIPEDCRWDALRDLRGLDLKNHYKKVLDKLGTETQGRVREIYAGAATNIDEPKNLEKIITSIDELDWFSAKEEGLGSLYEGLLEKNANEKKSGAGQYFTPRVLIDVMTHLVKPQPGERCNDPACGTFGFMIAAAQYVRDMTDDYADLTEELANFEVEEAFSGCELVHDTHRLALMNAMLHGIDGPIYLGDTLSDFGKRFKDYDVVLTNPPLSLIYSMYKYKEEYKMELTNRELHTVDRRRVSSTTLLFLYKKVDYFTLNTQCDIMPIRVTNRYRRLHHGSDSKYQYTCRCGSESSGRGYISRVGTTNSYSHKHFLEVSNKA